MSAAPAACGGVVAVIDVALATVTPVAAIPPIETLAPAAKLLPEIVSPRPPPVAPRPGDTADRVGAAAGGGLWGDGPAGDDPPPHDIANVMSKAPGTRRREHRGSVCIACLPGCGPRGAVQPLRQRRDQRSAACFRGYTDENEFAVTLMRASRRTVRRIVLGAKVLRPSAP